MESTRRHAASRQVRDIWQKDNDESQEDEEDLFASSPSPAIVNETQIGQNPGLSEDKPSALDSVERVSAGLFSPTQQAQANLDAAKYDISPINDGSPVKGYTGFEPMITDDDFDFFDGQNSPNQQETFAEYGDLANGDFGVNMNQGPDSRATGENKEATVDDANTTSSVKDNIIEGDLMGPPALDRDIKLSPANIVTTPQESIRSDDDLWNDNSLLEQLEESAREQTIATGQDDGGVPQVETSGALPTFSLPLDFNPAAPVIAAISTFARVDPIPILPEVFDYGRPLQWSVAAAAEKLTPTDFQEIVFNRPFFEASKLDELSLSVDGTSCLADVYGDGRVRVRRGLIELLEAQVSTRRNRSLGLLPFHARNTIEEFDMSSPRSTTSQDTQNSAGSADEVSEIASMSPAFDDGDCQDIMQAGHYPFGELDAFFQRRYLASLEEQDRNILQQKMADAEDVNVEASPLTEFSGVRSNGSSQSFEFALATTCDLESHYRFPSALADSGRAEYHESSEETNVRVRVGLRGNVMELSSAALPHWSELGLEPICGRQNVQTSILYQHGIGMPEAKAFFRGVAEAYASLNFGSHHLLEGGRAIRRIESSHSPYFDQTLKGDMTYVLLLTGDLENRELLEAINTYNARNGGTAFPIFLPDLSHPKAFSRLSFQVYHLLRRKNRGSTFHSSSEDPHLQQSAFTIVSAPEDSKVSFALRWPAPVLDIIEGERTLHIAYRLDNATKSAFVWCMDECGQAWRRHEWQFESTEMGVQDVWAFAMVFTGMANVHWRLVIVRYGDLTYPEVQAWHRIFQQESESATGAFAAELVACRARHEVTHDTSIQHSSRIKLFSRRQCLFVGNTEPAWVAPLCSATIQRPPISDGVLPPSTDLHLLLRMSTASVGFLRSDTQVLVRIAHQFEALRDLGIHRWFFDNHTPWPAHLHAVHLDVERGGTHHRERGY
ncbi:hypothetical protein NCC49_006507 [Naganishia albida]|nr:hypothetical protein NCC49_006507 [Naganishia albida]